MIYRINASTGNVYVAVLIALYGKCSIEAIAGSGTERSINGCAIDIIGDGGEVPIVEGFLCSAGNNDVIVMLIVAQSKRHIIQTVKIGSRHPLFSTGCNIVLNRFKVQPLR